MGEASKTLGDHLFLMGETEINVGELHAEVGEARFHMYGSQFFSSQELFCKARIYFSFQ